eukprot:m.17536 g.17536  ORF g.17536 m.17536 type:complete len:690 (-) comp8156_c0_seq3:186-2255(-)
MSSTPSPPSSTKGDTNEPVNTVEGEILLPENIHLGKTTDGRCNDGSNNITIRGGNCIELNLLKQDVDDKRKAVPSNEVDSRSLSWHHLQTKWNPAKESSKGFKSNDEDRHNRIICATTNSASDVNNPIGFTDDDTLMSEDTTVDNKCGFNSIHSVHNNIEEPFINSDVEVVISPPSPANTMYNANVGVTSVDSQLMSCNCICHMMDMRAFQSCISCVQNHVEKNDIEKEENEEEGDSVEDSDLVNTYINDEMQRLCEDDNSGGTMYTSNESESSSESSNKRDSSQQGELKETRELKRSNPFSGFTRRGVVEVELDANNDNEVGNDGNNSDSDDENDIINIDEVKQHTPSHTHHQHTTEAAYGWYRGSSSSSMNHHNKYANTVMASQAASMREFYAFESQQQHHYDHFIKGKNKLSRQSHQGKRKSSFNKDKCGYKEEEKDDSYNPNSDDDSNANDESQRKRKKTTTATAKAKNAKKANTNKKKRKEGKKEEKEEKKEKKRGKRTTKNTLSKAKRKSSQSSSSSDDSEKSQRKCPFPKCDSSGHVSKKFSSHVSLRGCPHHALAMKKKLVVGETVKTRFSGKLKFATILQVNGDEVKLRVKNKRKDILIVPKDRVKVVRSKTKPKNYVKANNSNRPYICSVDGCNNRYKGPSGLYYHMASSHPEFAMADMSSSFETSPHIPPPPPPKDLQ